MASDEDSGTFDNSKLISKTANFLHQASSELAKSPSLAVEIIYNANKLVKVCDQFSNLNFCPNCGTPFCHVTPKIELKPAVLPRKRVRKMLRRAKLGGPDSVTKYEKGFVKKYGNPCSPVLRVTCISCKHTFKIPFQSYPFTQKLYPEKDINEPVKQPSSKKRKKRRNKKISEFEKAGLIMPLETASMNKVPSSKTLICTSQVSAKKLKSRLDGLKNIKEDTGASELTNFLNALK